jgi:PAS domain-containing protein
LVEVIEGDENVSLHKFINSSSEHKASQALQLLLSRLFFVLSKLTTPPDSHEGASYAKFIILTFWQAIQITQIISLEIAFSPSLQLVVWQVIIYVRADWMAYRLGLLSSFLYFSYSYILSIGLLLAISMVSFDTQSRVFQASTRLTRLLLSRVFEFLYIPFLVILVASMKYSDESLVTLSEYEGIPKADLGTSYALAFASGLCFVLLNAFEVFRLVSFGSIRFTSARLNDYSRSCSKFEFLSRLAYCFIVGIYFFADLLHPTAFRLTASAVGLCMAYYLSKTLPYFKCRANSVKFISFIVLCWTGIALEVGSFVGSPVTGFVLILFVSPVLGLGAATVCPSKLSQIEADASSKISTTRDQVEFELYLRVKLASCNTSAAMTAIQDSFNHFRNRASECDKMLDISEVNFCVDILSDPKLASVKLAKLLRPGFSIEAAYNEFCLREHLSKKSLKSEESTYLEFTIKLDEVKQLDQQITISFYKMWNEFTFERPNIQTLVQHYDYVDRLADVVDAKFDEIIKAHPQARQVYSLYSTYLNVIMKEADEAKQILLNAAKAEANRSSREARNLKDFSYYDETNGILIVDTHPDNFAKVVYANERAAAIFGVSFDSFIGTDLNSYIPPPYNKRHREAMQHFVKTCRKTTLELPFNLFVYTQAKYLKDCSIVIKITAVNSYPIFLAAVVDRPITKEIALVSSDGKIYSHSQGLSDYLGLRQTRLNGYSIEELVPIEFDQLEEFVAFSVMKGSIEVKMAYAVTMVNKLVLRILFFFISDDEYMSWIRGTNQAAVEDLKRFLEVSQVREEAPEIVEPQTPKRRSVRIHNERSYVFDHERVKSTAAGVPTVAPLKSTTSSSNLTMSESKRLHKLTHDNFKLALKMSRWLTYACAAVVVVANLGIMISVVVRVNNIRQPRLFEVLCDVTYDTIFLGLNARFLNLAYHGIELMTVDQIQANIKEAVGALNDNVRYLEDSKDAIKEFGINDIYSHDYVRQWKLVNGQPTLSHKSIFDFGKDFLTSASVLSDIQVERAALTNPDVFMVYRNGLAEGFVKLNTTVGEYMDLETNYIERIEADLLTIYAVSISLISICFLGTALSFFRLQHTFNLLWKQLTNFTSTQAVEVKMSLVDRLSSFYGDDLVSSLQHSESHESRKRHRVESKGSVKLNVSRPLLGKLSLLFAVTGLCFIVFYFVCFLNLGNALGSYSRRIQITNQIKVSSLSLIVWAEEIVLRDTPDLDVSFTIHSYFSDPAILLEDEIVILDIQAYKLNEPALKTLSFSKKSMIQDTVDTDEPFFKLGLYSALLGLRRDLEAIKVEKDLAELKKMAKLVLLLTGFEDQVLSSLRDQLTIEVNSRIQQMEVITIAYCLLTLLASYFGYKRMFKSLEDKANRYGKFLVLE